MTLLEAVIMREIGETIRGKELLKSYGSDTAKVIAEFEKDLPTKFAEIKRLAETQLVKKDNDDKLIVEQHQDSDVDEPGIYELEPDEKVGTIGLYKDGTVRVIASGKEGGKWAKWVSDCAVYVHTQTTCENGDREIIFHGRGAKDGKLVTFVVKASDLAKPVDFRAALLKAFGAENKVGKLTYEMVQTMSINVHSKIRIEVPRWRDNIPMLPGVGLTDSDVEFDLSEKVPALVYDGDLDAAKKELRRLLGFHRFAPVIIATMFGAPAFARWFPHDRFGLGLWWESGAWKTTFSQLVMAVYGIDFIGEPQLKAGKNGSTPVGALRVCASAGFLPEIYDNVKSTEQRSFEVYVGVIHAVVEGGDKTRGKKDIGESHGLQKSQDFACTLVATGEVRPEEASTTARVLNLRWSKPSTDEALAAKSKDLAEIQANKASLPVLGYRWLRFLATPGTKLCPDFAEKQTAMFEKLAPKEYMNPGRLATIHTLLFGTWDLLELSPLGDVFMDFREDFEAALSEAIDYNGAAATEETEIAKFLGGLNALLVSRPDFFQDSRPGDDGLESAQNKPTTGNEHRAGTPLIGKWIYFNKVKSVQPGLFVLPNLLLAELNKTKVFNQIPNVDSITQSLHAKGLLIPDKDGRHLQAQQWINGGKARGWYIKLEAFPTDG